MPRAISREEIDRLLAAPANSLVPKAQRDHALLELLYASGMRVTELVSLDIEDLDLDTGIVRVQGKKNVSKERSVTIDAPALESVKTYLKKGRLQLLRDANEKAHVSSTTVASV